MMIAAPQARVAPAPLREETAAVTRVDLLAGPVQDCPAADANAGEEIVVCGRRDDGYRLRRLPPPPPSEGLLTRPLRVRIAPGVSFGLQPGGGIGLKAQFGPGKRSD